MTGIIIGAAVGLAVAFGVSPFLIRLLRAKAMGQPIHELVTQHSAKSGTPTMGGLVIPLGAVCGYLAAWAVTGDAPTQGGLAVLGTVIGGCVVGFTDDWLKVRRARNLGLREMQKTIMESAVLIGFCVAYLLSRSPCTHLSLTSCSAIPWNPGPVGWSIFAVAVLWATSNGANFTDGLEGLLSGSAAISFAALAAIGVWEYRNPGRYHVAGALDLSILAATLSAACVGFLWWNGRPTTIFMGDSGSLAIGMGIGALALSLDVGLLLPVLGVLYALEGASSSLQRYTYKLYFKPRGSRRRLFRMAPLHHHFELAGWREHTILVRFWIISAAGAVAALAAVYAASPRRR